MDMPAAVRRFIERQRVARLATVDASGLPHLVPICFALDGDVLYSVVDEKPKRTMHLQRLKNIETQPAVAVLLDEYDEDWTQLQVDFWNRWLERLKRDDDAGLRALNQVGLDARSLWKGFQKVVDFQ